MEFLKIWILLFTECIFVSAQFINKKMTPEIHSIEFFGIWNIRREFRKHDTNLNLHSGTGIESWSIALKRAHPKNNGFFQFQKEECNPCTAPDLMRWESEWEKRITGHQGRCCFSLSPWLSRVQKNPRVNSVIGRAGKEMRLWTGDGEYNREIFHTRFKKNQGKKIVFYI